MTENIIIAILDKFYGAESNSASDLNMSDIVFTDASFKQEVLEDKGAVVVDFWAPWCGPCKMIAPTLNEIAETESDIVIGKVNVDHNQDLAKKYKVRNIPTMVIFKNGVEVGRIVGVKTKKAILNEVRNAVAV